MNSSKPLKTSYNKQRKSLNNLHQSNNFYSTTQSIFDSKLNPLKQIQENYSMFKDKHDFYKTSTNSTNWGSWVRPQSKQACRKIISRPQTSKGLRKQSVKDMFSNYKKQNAIDYLTLQNNSITSNGLSKLTKSSNNNIFNSTNRRSKRQLDIKKQNNAVHIHNQYDQFGQIQIVINKRNFNVQKKGQSMHRNKFQTDLDDQFLQLFAD